MVLKLFREISLSIVDLGPGKDGKHIVISWRVCDGNCFVMFMFWCMFFCVYYVSVCVTLKNDIVLHFIDAVYIQYGTYRIRSNGREIQASGFHGGERSFCRLLDPDTV
jgi:hypothetical protein